MSFTTILHLAAKKNIKIRPCNLEVDRAKVGTQFWDTMYVFNYSLSVTCMHCSIRSTASAQL